MAVDLNALGIRTVNGSSSTGVGAGAASGAKKSLNDLGAGDFMTLMMAQLKNQDPLKPTDNTAFIAQMAQLTSVSGINDMKTALQDMSTSLRGTQLLNASSLIGQSVVVGSSTAKLDAGEGLQAQVNLPVATPGLNISIVGANGEVVRSATLGPQASGPFNFSWDGKDAGGNPVPAGSYTVKATYGVAGAATEATTFLRRPVQSVNLPSSGSAAELDVRGVGTVKLADVKSIG